MKSKKHILILTPGFPGSESDSTCIPPLQALILELISRYNQELQISVVAFQYPFNTGVYNWNGIKCWSAGGKNKLFPLKFITWARIFGFIKKLHKQHPVDIVHSFWLHDCTLVGQWVAKLSGAKHVAHAMGQDILADNLYIRFLNRKNLSVIANSPFSYRMLQKEFNIDSFSMIPFGIQPNDFINIPESNRKIDLLAVGSLTDVKNHELFIEIFAILKQSFPFLTGSIIGGGPLIDILRKKIQLHELDDCLHIEGEQSRREVLIRMSESKILLHTASFESAGYVFLEALYSGMKVVSFQTGFLPEVPGAFPCKDKTGMLQILHKLLIEKQEYLRVEVPLISETAEAIFKIYKEN